MNAYLVIVDSMHDWEVGYLMAELRSRRFFADPASSFALRLAAVTDAAVTSMGGATYIPDVTVGSLALGAGDVLVLPGSAQWDAPAMEQVYALARTALGNGAGVAAIGNATIGLAREGLLDMCRHASCQLDLLQQLCPQYRGQRWYRREAAVRGDKLITASPLGALEFSYEVLKMLKVWHPETASAWYRWHKTRQHQWFDALLETLPAQAGTPCVQGAALL